MKRCVDVPLSVRSGGVPWWEGQEEDTREMPLVWVNECVESIDLAHRVEL